MSLRRSLIPAALLRQTDLALQACMLVCVLNALLARLMVPTSNRVLQLAGVGLVLFLPVVQRSVLRSMEWRPGSMPAPALLAFCIQLLFVGLLPAHGFADRLMVISTWLAMQVGLYRKSSSAAALLVTLTPLQALAAMAGTPSSAWLIAFPMTLVVSSVGVVLLSLQLTRERVERRASRAHLRAWLSRDEALDAIPALRTRWLPAASLSFAVLAGMALAYPLLVALPRPSFNPRSPGLGAAGNAGSAAQARLEAELNGATSSDSTFPGDIRPGGSLNGRLGELSYETLMTVSAFPAGQGNEARDVGPLYVRAICLDTFTETGLRSNANARLERLSDSGDGASDGWIQLAERDTPVVMELQIRQNVLRVPGSDAAVLFAVQPALAIDLPSVRHDPDFMLALPSEVNLGEVAFRMRVGQEPLARWTGGPLHARHPDPRFLQLPRASADRRWIEDRAKIWTRSAENDYERITAIVGHLRSDFGYTTKTTDVPGTLGIVNFMRREQGHCTSFAAAAVLMLRSLQIPSRVVTGFLAEEYDEEAGGYLVSRSNGHAWIEVHLEGLGWQPFETTSSRRRTQAMLAARSGEDDGLATWASTLSSDFSAWARSGADEAYFDQFQGTLLDGPRAAAASLRRHPLWAGGLLVIVIALILGLRSRSKTRAEKLPTRSRDLDLYETWLAGLGRHGKPRAHGMTLREWTGSLSLPKTGDMAQELPQLVRLFYRARFGNQDLQESERDQVREWLQRLDAATT